MKETIISIDTMEKVKLLSTAASANKGSVTVYSGRYIVDGKSMMGLFSLNLSQPVKIEIEGEICQELKDAVTSLRTEA